MKTCAPAATDRVSAAVVIVVSRESSQPLFVRPTLGIVNRFLHSHCLT